MPVYTVVPRMNTFFDRQLPNGVYRYEGRHAGINFCIDSRVEKTEEEIRAYLTSRKVDFLMDAEGRIITLRN